jgi:hypothetical protein
MHYRGLLFAIILFAYWASTTGNALAGGSLLETFFSQNDSSDEINRQGTGSPIQVDTSALDFEIKTKAAVNKGLRAIGLPSMLGPPKVQRQSAWVKGRGFVDITDQAQRQVDADFHRVNNGSSPTKRTMMGQPFASGRTIGPSSLMQSTSELNHRNRR